MIAVIAITTSVVTGGTVIDFNDEEKFVCLSSADG